MKNVKHILQRKFQLKNSFVLLQVENTRERVVNLKMNADERGKVLPVGSLQAEEMTSS